ncbi:MAG: RNA chaperone Hfq [Oscillospiraceae bacterium]|nr:RNA chaperone Hfq [Oscillospiraceae bacterium]MBR2896866.1 RNA chaperone Hfq [Oscillospiraceae bacterium]MBR2977371.1 RNA chaperone Hfq [Oscillospiraceae bacterium]
MQTEHLQDRFLHQLRTERTPITLFLVNGFQIRCSIAAFDAFAVLVLADGKQELIYKHAISTIIPSVPVKTD